MTETVIVWEEITKETKGDFMKKTEMKLWKQMWYIWEGCTMIRKEEIYLEDKNWIENTYKGKP